MVRLGGLLVIVICNFLHLSKVDSLRSRVIINRRAKDIGLCATKHPQTQGDFVPSTQSHGSAMRQALAFVAATQLIGCSIISDADRVLASEGVESPAVVSIPSLSSIEDTLQKEWQSHVIDPLSKRLSKDGKDGTNFDAWTEPIYNFRFSIPEKSGLLTSTTRGERNTDPLTPPKYFWSSNQGISPESTFLNKPVLDDDFKQYRQAIVDFVSSLTRWENLAMLAAFVLVIDSFKQSRAASDYALEQAKILKDLAAVDTSSKSDGNHHDHRHSEMKEELDSTKKLLESTQDDLISAKEQIWALMQDIKNLKHELSKRNSNSSGNTTPAPAPAPAPAPVPASLSVASSSENRAQREFIETIKKRDDALMSALKSFLINEGYIAPGVANMMMVSTAPDVLKGLSSSSKATSTSQKAAPSHSDLEAKIKTLESEKMALEAKVASSASKKSSSSQAISAASSDTQKYVKELSAENNELKQKLLQSEQTLWNLQQDMQSKLDSAKAVAQELNVKLMDRSGQAETYERMKVLQNERDRAISELSAAKAQAQEMAKALASSQATSTSTSASSSAPSSTSSTKTRAKKATTTNDSAQVASTVTKKTRSASEMKLIGELKALKAYQIRNKLRAELEDIAKTLKCLPSGDISGFSKKDLGDYILAFIERADS